MTENTCCQCGSVGSVVNKYAPEATRDLRPQDPITWICAACRRHVCINCVLTIPDTIPIEIADDTLCSIECQQALLLRDALLRA